MTKVRGHTVVSFELVSQIILFDICTNTSIKETSSMECWKAQNSVHLCLPSFDLATISELTISSQETGTFFKLLNNEENHGGLESRLILITLLFRNHLIHPISPVHMHCYSLHEQISPYYPQTLL